MTGALVRLTLMPMRHRPQLFVALTLFVAACGTTNVFNTIAGPDAGLGGPDGAKLDTAQPNKDAPVTDTTSLDVSPVPDTSAIADSSVPDTSDAADTAPPGVDSGADRCPFPVAQDCIIGNEFRATNPDTGVDDNCGNWAPHCPRGWSCHTINNTASCP